MTPKHVAAWLMLWPSNTSEGASYNKKAGRPYRPAFCS